MVRKQDCWVAYSVPRIPTNLLRETNCDPNRKSSVEVADDLVLMDLSPVIITVPIFAMKTLNQTGRAFLMAICAAALGSSPTRASIAYGSINNFDTVNDTGHECHGFEIEIEDCHSTDISYTYNYNHYGVPKITEDDSVPAHPKCVIRWESKKNPDLTWAAYTAIPAGPVSPTDGHMFTNPSINFGGEHFGAGYSATVGAIRYRWLIDDGSGNLVNGGAVQVSTPTFTYYQPAGGAPAQVQAVIAPPPPAVPVPKEFGKAVWVKEIKTSSHNNRKVELRDLVSDDPDDDHDRNWRNDEPDEVEVEWRILQKRNSLPDGGINNQVPAAAEELPDGDEVVTRRYEFYKYVGPLDAETGEAMGDAVGADGSHGTGTVSYADHFNGATGEWVIVTTDMSGKVVVGDFTGSQMAAVDVEAPVGLIEHVGEGEVGKPYTARTVVIEGALPFASAKDGNLPNGMVFDDVTGVLSGTPSESGDFNFTITATDAANPEIFKNYTLRIAAAGMDLDPASLVDTTVSPINAGTTIGDGLYVPGAEVSVEATPLSGFQFVNWTDHGAVVSDTPVHTFTIDVNHSLVANFVALVPQWMISTSTSSAEGGTTVGGGLLDEGSDATVIATPNVGYVFSGWTEGGTQVSSMASFTFPVTGDRSLLANFTTAPTYTIATSATPAGAGTMTGSGLFTSGTNITVTATANPGYVFTKWTVGSASTSVLPSYSFTVTGNSTLVAHFVVAGAEKSITTSASPLAGGGTSGGGNYANGDTATVIATPNPNYAFAKWQVGGITVSTSPSYTFFVDSSRMLVAKFNEAFVITAKTSPSVGGTTEMDSQSYKSGEKALAKALPTAGFSFSNWTENGVVVSTTTNYSFNVTGNRTLFANFLSNTNFTITTNPAPSEGGSTIGDNVYSNNDAVAVSAVPNDGYVFASWSEGGAVVSTDANYNFLAHSSHALVARFAVPYTITTSASSSPGGVVKGQGIYPGGNGATVTATPNPGYIFTGWSENGTVVSTSESYTFMVNVTRVLTAGFEIIPALTTAREVTAPGMMELSWPAASTNWNLQESPNMQAGSWQNSARGITNRGSLNTTAIPMTQGKRFFRLARP